MALQGKAGAARRMRMMRAGLAVALCLAFAVPRPASAQDAPAYLGSADIPKDWLSAREPLRFDHR